MAEQQSELVFEPGEKGRLLRAAREAFGLTPERNKRVFDLVKALDELGWQDGCRPRLKRIANQVGVSPRSVQRAIADAVELGVVAVVERQREDGGRASNEYVIQWDAIRRLTHPTPQKPPRHNDVTPRHCDVPPRHNVAPLVLALSSCEKKEPPPPGSSAARNRKRGGEPVGDAWREVEEVLVACELGAPRSAAEKARAAGLSPEAVLDLVAYWRSQAPAFGPGALYRRICEAVPGQAVETGWPAPSAEAAARAAAEEAARAKERAAAEAQQTAEAARRELTRLESLAGQRLDRMSRDDRDRLAREALDDGSGGGGVLLRRYVVHHQREPPSAWPAEMRLRVLRALVSDDDDGGSV